MKGGCGLGFPIPTINNVGIEDPRFGKPNRDNSPHPEMEKVGRVKVGAAWVSICWEQIRKAGGRRAEARLRDFSTEKYL